MAVLKYIRFLFIALTFYSCDGNKKEAIDNIVREWMGKEILFPNNSIFVTYTGDKLLAIQNVVTSCGCTSVEYPKEPIKVNGSAELHVTYRADYPEHFSKVITVYCNTENSPIVLRITGEGGTVSGN